LTRANICLTLVAAIYMPIQQTVLILNGGSSSIKFGLYPKDDPPRPILAGKLERIRTPEASFKWTEAATGRTGTEKMDNSPQQSPAEFLRKWLDARPESAGIAAVAHRIVHGGNYNQPQLVTPDLLTELRRIGPYDPDHFPGQMELISVFDQRSPKVPQVACFDTAFHHDMPRVAKIVPLPRRYESAGIRRYGFHGLSYTFLLEELERVAGAEATRGRLILAHLGNGANGQCLDTTMCFTPTAGLVMSTRTGDLDPGIFVYLSRTENMSPEQFQHLVNYESGLRGISETSSDMRDLSARAATDPRAAEAIEVFCYQARKWVGALATVLGGVDTLVFAGGIGENDADVRERICAGLDFLGITIDAAQNKANAPVISPAHGGPATVRIIHTNEESVMAKAAWRLVS
jgi:acetate kinase